MPYEVPADAGSSGDFTFENGRNGGRKLDIGLVALIELDSLADGEKLYNLVMAKDVIHISEAEAANDFSSLLARVSAGAEVVIESNARPVAVVRPAEPQVRLLSESLRLAKERGSKATLDGSFGRDLEEIINSHREPLTPPAWN